MISHNTQETTIDIANEISKKFKDSIDPGKLVLDEFDALLQALITYDSLTRKGKRNLLIAFLMGIGGFSGSITLGVLLEKKENIPVFPILLMGFVFTAVLPLLFTRIKTFNIESQLNLPISKISPEHKEKLTNCLALLRAIRYRSFPLKYHTAFLTMQLEALEKELHALTISDLIIKLYDIYDFMFAHQIEIFNSFSIPVTPQALAPTQPYLQPEEEWGAQEATLLKSYDINALLQAKDPIKFVRDELRTLLREIETSYFIFTPKGKLAITSTFVGAPVALAAVVVLTVLAEKYDSSALFISAFFVPFFIMLAPLLLAFRTPLLEHEFDHHRTKNLSESSKRQLSKCLNYLHALAFDMPRKTDEINLLQTMVFEIQSQHPYWTIDVLSKKMRDVALFLGRNEFKLSHYYPKNGIFGGNASPNKDGKSEKDPLLPKNNKSDDAVNPDMNPVTLDL